MAMVPFSKPSSCVHSPVFWQYFLSAEFPPEKGASILREIEHMDCEPISFLLSHPLLTPAEGRRMSKASLSALEKVLNSGAEVLVYKDFPENLNRMEISPPALFVVGKKEALFSPCISIVGTRNATAYGKAIAMRFAKYFGSYGITVVSGGAVGIDASAHRGALEVNALTIAVLPTGIDQWYPGQNAPLFEQIKSSGLLVSQFSVSAKWHSGRPLLRNHLIAALSDAVLIVEAPDGSGALSTAQAAAELSRDVFVVPANIDNQNYFGSHRLIRDGATLVDHPAQVLEHLQIERKEVAFQGMTSVLRQKIRKILSQEPMSAEKVVAQSGLLPSEVLSELTLMEVEGEVFRDIGGYALG